MSRSSSGDGLAWGDPVAVGGLWLLVITLALTGLSVLAYALRALDLLGAVASFFLGLEVALLGGIQWLVLMTLFPILGVLTTRIGYRRKAERRVAEAAGGERGVGNVLGNGLGPGLAALALLFAPFVPPQAAALAFATALAAVTADTVASEIGVLSGRARGILPPFRPMPIGVNGAVSLPGQCAALAGATAIAAAAFVLLGLPAWLAWVPAVAGFLGCQFDSVLGATLERDDERPGPLSKQDVNFIASAVPAFVVLVIATLVL
ncbi:MAG TPA: DUF92 domain-containing protein [Candidatus Thermoplasmatota archaeon]|nr:DUF92 domain-containing protein [Candidatus Thermoplasmatota archaeon]